MRNVVWCMSKLFFLLCEEYPVVATAHERSTGAVIVWYSRFFYD